MKEYKVESLIYYSKMTLDSTDSMSFGWAAYIYLYFVRDAE